MKKRKRVIKAVLTLAKLFNVAYYIAQKYYNKVNGDIKKAKEFLTVHKILYPNCA